jgi:hypothetical protein
MFWFLSIGHSSLVDPGPPNQTFSCESNATDHPDSATRCESRVQNSGETESDLLPSATTTSVATQTRSTIHDPSLEASFDPTQPNGNSNSNSNSNDKHDNDNSDDGLSTGVKVTIALATFATLVLLVLGILAFLRYRSRPPHRRNLCQYLKDKYRSLYPSAAALPTPPSPPLSPARPLLSHKLPQTNRDGVPLTPPLPPITPPPAVG